MVDQPEGTRTRLLVAANNFPPKQGGIERFVDGLARHAWPGETVAVAPPFPGAETHDAAAPFVVRRAPFTMARPPRWWPAHRAVAAAVREFRPEHVLCGQPWPDARALATVRRRGETRSVICHGTDVALARAGGSRRRWQMARTLAAVDVVIANSAFTAALAADLGADPVVINPGVELDAPADDPAAVRHRLGLGDGPLVVTVARLVERKGHVPFLTAWAAVREREPDATWVVVGDGPERDRLAAAAAGTGGVALVGPRPDPEIQALYRTAAAHVLPGHVAAGEVEGFGMVVVEAGAAGTPTVATDSGGTAEAVGAGGIVVPEHEPRLLADAIVELLQDGARRADLGRAARTRAELLDWRLVAARFREAVGVG